MKMENKVIELTEKVMSVLEKEKADAASFTLLNCLLITLDHISRSGAGPEEKQEFLKIMLEDFNRGVGDMMIRIEIEEVEE